MDKTTKIDWKVKGLRLTLFPDPIEKIEISELWPKTFKLEKQSSSPITGESILEGTNGDDRVVLIKLPIKIDLIIDSGILNFTSDGIKTLGSLDEVLKKYRKEIDVLMSFFTKLNRIALGVELIKTVQNSEEGYKLISGYLPFKLDRSEYSDFKLTLNKPVNSSYVKDLKINQLTNWGVMKSIIELSALSSKTASYKYPESYFCSLSLDINTIAEYEGIFEQGQYPGILNELIKLADNLMENGIK